MNRRDFLTVISGAGVASLSGIRPALASKQTTNLYLKGLVMLAIEDSTLRIGFPKAPGHKATLQIQPVSGTVRKIALKGHGKLETTAIAGGDPIVRIPEIVRMSEFYGPDVKSKFDRCPTVIEIPMAAVRSITTDAVSKDRWTFVRADNGQEINTFRPRQIAESLQVELSSNGVLKLNGGKVSLPLETIQGLRSNYEPEPKDRYPSMFEDHFTHYYEYMEKPPAADFLVVPKKLAGNSNPAPRIGNQYLMIDSWPLCYLVLICGVGW
jgi:hypothetical protein